MSSTAPAARSLAQWLDWQQRLHPRAIDMTLERVVGVARRLDLLPFPGFVFTVGGTNGKGSCALTLGHLLQTDRRVGVYTSPYLLRYNERVRIDGEPVDDAALCAAFAEVEAARQDTSLTYFEFGTLAALWLFARAGVDTAILEVGMGGRLDAVNIVDADAALITNIGLDHVDWLGDTRAAIGCEKAGIMRAGQPVLCTDRDPPDSIAQAATQSGARLLQIGRDFDLTEDEQGDWRWRGPSGRRLSLAPCANLLRDNLAGVLGLLDAAGIERSPAELARRLAGYAVPGRRQTWPGAVPVVLDVAHNLEAMQLLIDWLAAQPVAGRDLFVLGMLENKPVEAIGRLLAPRGPIFAGGLEAEARGLSGEALQYRLGASARAYADVGAALAAARREARAGDRIVVCGSFHTLAAVMQPDAEETRSG